MNYPVADIFCEEQLVGLAQKFTCGQCVVTSSRSPDKTTEHSNEDSCMLLQLGDHTGVLAVADGAGGHIAGREASQLAIAILQRELCSHSSPDNLRAPILNAFEACNRQLLHEGRGSATTLAVVEMQQNVMRHYLVGDSSIILAGQRGAIRLQTVPQSLVGYGIEAGLLHEDAALKHDERHIVLNLLGTPDMRVEMGAPLRLQRYDTLLLCSDGLTDNVAVNDAVELFRSGDMVQSLSGISELAHRNMMLTQGHPDDLTMLLFRQGSA